MTTENWLSIKQISRLLKNTRSRLAGRGVRSFVNAPASTNPKSTAEIVQEIDSRKRRKMFFIFGYLLTAALLVCILVSLL